MSGRVNDGSQVTHRAAGWHYQVVTSRMRYISSQKEGDGEAPIRIVGLCTSLANAKDLGEWVGATSHGLFNFPPGVAPSSMAVYIVIPGIERLLLSTNHLAGAQLSNLSSGPPMPILRDVVFSYSGHVRVFDLVLLH
jgi:hypothetical protein